MKGYGNVITYFTIIGFLIIIALGYLIFHKMNLSLLHQQEEQFHFESESKIQGFQDRINNITNQFQVYSQLPSFKSIRFYSLTLNHLAVAESTRQLELFFFDLLQKNNYLQSVRFIDDKGDEVFHVDRNAIHYKLGNISQYIHETLILEQDLQVDDTHIEVIRNTMAKPQTLIWWVPVYTSRSKRLGHLAFHVDVSVLGKEMLNMSETGLNYMAITSDADNLFLGEHQLITEPLPEDMLASNGKWINSERLSLSGLDWSINIIGNETIYTRGINAIQYAVNFGFIPTAVLILIVLFYIFRKKAESDNQVHHLAYYDSLTGLVNRHQFDQALANALEESREHHVQHALLYLDLDQFKIVNDTCGHIAGDKLLEELATHLKLSVRDSDMLARLGGDEFALLLNLCPEEKALFIANKILDTVADFRFAWNDKYFTIGVSIGAVFITDSEETSGNVLRKADLACYMAKELGRNRIHVYNDEDQKLEQRHGEMQWVERIRQAIDDNLFFLEAQYIEPLADKPHPVRRYEILIRLNDNGKPISPDAFIPAAERYGVMTDIDRWVVENAFAFMKQMLDSVDDQGKACVFSINLSGLSLGDANFFSFIKTQFEKHHIPPKSICFEITETAAITNLSIAIDFIQQVKALGCALALDDFGSGLCSFSYLKTIPVDYLKIDGVFVTRMLENPLDMAIVTAIKQISIATKSRVIAEFVESHAIREKLRELGIDYAQGYAVAKPVKLDSLLS